MKNNKKKSFRLLRLMDWNAGNRPDAPDEDTRPTLKRYFKLLGRRFWKLVSLNIMMVPMILPLLIMFYLFVSADRTPIETHAAFAQLYGAGLIESTPETTLLLDLYGTQTYIPAYGIGTYIGIGICAVIMLITWGWQNVGSTYILRSMVRGEPVFLFSDYFYAVKRNLKQGLLMGILDLIVIGLLLFDFMYFYGIIGSFWIDVCFWGICALAILYFFMRFYIYLMLVTFDLSIKKILKNALIFTTLGIKRNLMATLGIILLTAIDVVLFAFFMPMNFPIALILPFLYYFSFTAFTSAYAAYPIIDRYMIAPYRTENDYPDKEFEDTDYSEETSGEEV